MRIRTAMLLVGLITASPAVAQTTADELARARLVNMRLLASQESALAQAKIALDGIFRHHNELAKKEGHRASFEMEVACSRDIEFELGGAWLNVEALQDLLSLSLVMQTADDREMVSLSLSNRAAETDNALLELMIATKAHLRSCPSNQREFSAMEAWIVQTTPVIDRIKETADAMSK